MSRCVEYYEVILPRQLRQDNSGEGCSHDLISKQSKSEILRYLQLVDTLEDSGISRASAIAYLTEGASRPLLREHDAEKKAAAIAKVAEAIKARIELADVKPRRVTEKDVERILNKGEAHDPQAKAAQPHAPEAEAPEVEAPEPVEAEVITTEAEEPEAEAEQPEPEPEPAPKPSKAKASGKNHIGLDASDIADSFKVLLKDLKEKYGNTSYFAGLREIKAIVADELKEARR